MRIISVSKGFSSAHSSVNYEFISEGKISSEAKQLVRQSGEQCSIRNNVISIHVPGEGYLSDRIEDALLTEHDIPLLIYEDYDWWNFILMFDYDEGLFKRLKDYESDTGDHEISVRKLGGKIRLWCIAHLDYGAIISDDPRVRSPFKPLREIFLEIRNRILEGDFKSLEILNAYCSGEELSEIRATDDLEEKLILYLEPW
jgi:hypothetical protein